MQHNDRGPTLAGDFPPATEDEWLALADKVLRGAPLSTLDSQTPGGIDVHPLYTRTNSPGGADEAGMPGSAPYVRGVSATRSDATGAEGVAWEVRAPLTHPAPTEANRAALRELERGATELQVRFGSAFRRGFSPADPEFAQLGGIDGILIASTADLLVVLDGVLLDLAAVHLQPGSQFARAGELMMAVWQQRQIADDDALGGLGADPLGTLAAQGELPQGVETALLELGSLAQRISGRFGGVRTVSVDTAAYVEAGASEVQELAAMLSTGVSYLRSMADAGLTADAACAQIEVTLSADADIFTTIAKLRAARRLWSQMTAACGASEPAQAMQLHVRTASRMMTARDPWVNLLRVTAATFGAGVGGAQSVTAAAFDSEIGEPAELGRRMARNTQLLLQEESNVGRVIDPAGGSWYVESLTEQISRAAWAEFQSIEAAGGLSAVLLDGSFAARIAEVRDARLERVATRRDPITGVSEFPDINEEPVMSLDPDLRTLRSRVAGKDHGRPSRPSTSATTIDALPAVRWSEQFEHLRNASDAYVGATGARPKVFLVNLGPVAVHTARASFAKNFFEAGGIEAVTSETGSTVGFDDATEAVADAMRSGAHLVCICSSDAVYAERAAEVATALRSAGLSPVYLAGKPGEHHDALVAAGVDVFIHVGVDALDILQRAHDSIGTPTGTITR